MLLCCTEKQNETPKPQVPTSVPLLTASLIKHRHRQLLRRQSCITRGQDRPLCTHRALGVPPHCTHTASTWLENRAQPHLLSTCCCSSCTFLHTSPAMAQVLPTLVKSAATLSVRRKPAALRLSMCRRHASTTPVRRGQRITGLLQPPPRPAPPAHCPWVGAGQGQSWENRQTGRNSESDKVSVCLICNYKHLVKYR